MAHLLEDWNRHGPDVLARVRQEDPSTYLRVAFGTLPKDVAISFENRSPLDSAEGRYLRRLVDIIAACAGDSDPMLVLICAAGTPGQLRRNDTGRFSTTPQIWKEID